MFNAKHVDNVIRIPNTCCILGTGSAVVATYVCLELQSSFWQYLKDDHTFELLWVSVEDVIVIVLRSKADILPVSQRVEGAHTNDCKLQWFSH